MNKIFGKIRWKAWKIVLAIAGVLLTLYGAIGVFNQLHDFYEKITGISSDNNNQEIASTFLAELLRYRWILALIILSIVIVIIIVFVKRRREEKNAEKASAYRFTAEAKNTDYVDHNYYLTDTSGFFDRSIYAFKWCIISSVAGMGKTRLVNELTEKQKENFWESLAVLETDYEDLIAGIRSKCTKAGNYIFVADDAQLHLSALGTLIEFFEEHYQEFKEKKTFIRLILLIRIADYDKDYYENGMFGQLLKGAGKIGSKGLTNHKHKDIILEPYDYDSLSEIGKNYIANQEMKEVEGGINLAWTTLTSGKSRKGIDPVFRRPLFFLFILDAIQDGRNPSEWDREEALDYVCDREAGFIESRLNNKLGTNRSDNIRREVECVICGATIVNGLSIDDFANRFHVLWDNFCKDIAFGRFKAPELLIKIYVASKDGYLHPRTPDLIGEYTALKNVVLNPDEEKIRWILQAANSDIDQFLAFLVRIYQDYKDVLAEFPEKTEAFWKSVSRYVCSENTRYDSFLNHYKDLKISDRFHIFAPIRHYLLNIVIDGYYFESDEYEDVLFLAREIDISKVIFTDRRYIKEEADRCLEHIETLCKNGNIDPNILTIYESFYGGRICAQYDRAKMTELLRKVTDKVEDKGCAIPSTLIAWIRFYIGAMDSYEGKYNEALIEDTKAYEIQKRLLGEEHPDTLRSLHCIGDDYSKLGRHEEALMVDEKVYEARKRVLGEEHPDTLISLQSIGSDYSKLGRYEEALKVTQEAYGARKRVLGEEHPDTLGSLHNIGVDYSNLGRHEEALKVTQEAYEARKRVLGEEHPDTLRSFRLIRVEQLYIRQYND